ncbi:MAG: hypothetical protein QF735_12355, partial [Phycisphaeraceae bacterium]|nr:hypothetical protein [Phycisphaeraceae bacterium]
MNRQEVGGHIPQIGDAGPDFSDHSPRRRKQVGRHFYNDVYLDSQIEAAWIRLVQGDASAVQLLVDIYGDKPPEPLSKQWSVYSVTPAHIAQLQSLKPRPDAFETTGTFYGAKGLALLRGGKGEKRYGAQLFFGPLHNHSQREALTWTFFARGSEWSYDPGYWNKHYRMGFTTETVGHQAVTIDGESHSWTGGSGHLLGWVDTPDVQWAMAAHPGAYADAEQFNRLIAQVHNPTTGELGYWLDVSIVEGGTQRDDSFHTRMTRAELDVDLPDEPFAAAMVGDIEYGKLLRADYYLEGYVDKGFYWIAPGAGYGFLGSPRRVAMGKTVRAVLTDPEGKPAPSTMIVDLLGAPGRELFVANSPAFIHIPAKPYLIRRDIGPGTSVFAKVLRFADDPIDSVEGVGGRVTVRWKDGRRDEWYIGGMV